MSFPLINVSQFFDSSGAPLANGTIEFRSPIDDTYIDTYPTADDADAQTNANANPLTLNARGEAASGIYLEDGVKYKITLREEWPDELTPGAVVWTQDDVLCPIALPYLQTAAENAAGVTPTNVEYPPGDVRRYGAVGDGVTDDTTAVESAIDSVGANGLVTVLPNVTYLTTLTQADIDNTNFTGSGTIELADGAEIRTGYVRVLSSNWTSDEGGRNVIFNPEATTLPTTLKNTNVVLGGRQPSYTVTLGDDAELSFHGGGGDNTLNHLAGVICGGAHHKLEQNSGGFGSHGFIGGGSYNDNYTDYGFIVAGTENTAWATRSGILGGYNNTIGVDGARLTGEGSIIGTGSTCSVQGAFASVLTGNASTANHDYAEVSGKDATSTHYGAKVRASGKFSSVGDAQTIDLTLRRITTNATATQLIPDDDTAVLVMGSQTVWAIDGTVVAKRTDTGTDTAAYHIRASATRTTGNAVIESSTVTVLHEDSASWDVDVIASDENVQIRGTGESGATVRWVASIRITQVRNV